MKYHDCPTKLRSHLPFGVDHNDNTKFSAKLNIPEEDLRNIYKANIKEVEDRMIEDLCMVGLTED